MGITIEHESFASAPPAIIHTPASATKTTFPLDRPMFPMPSSISSNSISAASVGQSPLASPHDILASPLQSIRRQPYPASNSPRIPGGFKGVQHYTAAASPRTPDWSIARNSPSSAASHQFESPASVHFRLAAAVQNSQQHFQNSQAHHAHQSPLMLSPQMSSSFSMPNLSQMSLSPNPANSLRSPGSISRPVSPALSINDNELQQMMLMQQRAIFGSPGSGMDLASFEAFQAQQLALIQAANQALQAGAGPSPNNRKLGLYKTELCRSFEERATCRYGSKCQFAHGMDELRNISRHPKYKTEICRTFWLSMSCPYGQRCCFVHSTMPTAGSPAVGSTEEGKQPGSALQSPSANPKSPSQNHNASSLLSRMASNNNSNSNLNSPNGLVGLGFDSVSYPDSPVGGALRGSVSMPSGLSLSAANSPRMTAHSRLNEAISADSASLFPSQDNKRTSPTSIRSISGRNSPVNAAPASNGKPSIATSAVTPAASAEANWLTPVAQGAKSSSSVASPILATASSPKGNSTGQSMWSNSKTNSEDKDSSAGKW